MVFTLHRYIFRDLIKTFLLATLVLSVVLGLGTMLRPLRDFSIDPIRVPELLLCTLPVTLTMVIPIAALLSATINYGRLAVENEILACRASGIGLMTLIYPALMLALLVGIATLLLAFHVIPMFSERIESIIKSDAEAIIYRNIEKKGNMGDMLPKYRIHADSAIPKEHRLIGVVVVRLDDKRQIEQIITAKEVQVQIDTGQKQNQVHLRLHDQILVEGEMTASMGDYVISTPIPSFLRDDIKFKRLEDLKAIREDMLQFSEVESLMDEIRYQYLAENFYTWCDRQLRQQGIVDLLQPHGRLRIHGGDCRLIILDKNKSTNNSARQKQALLHGADGQKVTVEEYADNNSNEPRKFYLADRGRFMMDSDAFSQQARLALESVQWHYARDAAMVNLAGYDFSQILLPRDLVVQAENLTLQNVLIDHSGLLAEPSEHFNRLCRKIQKMCAELKLDIDIEIHSRLAFGVCCVALVLLGAALGIIFRSGHLLMAFGISCIPACVCLITIFTGKHIAEQSGMSLQIGVAFLWSGIVIVTIVNALVYRALMKR